MKDLMLTALDEAVRQHVVKMFGVLMSDPTDLAVQRFATGIGNTMAAHERLRKVVCELCDEQT
jgi:hypothetical protein